MTFSLLAFDEETGTFGGVAATGNLCVGGWVLAGHAKAGMCASQGHTPSTLWRDEVLALQAAGAPASNAIAKVSGSDDGRAYRQIASIDLQRRTASFTGHENIAYCGSIAIKHAIATGNILRSENVLHAMLEAFSQSKATFPERLLSALKAGKATGGDDRGVLSAALLQVGPGTAPLDLRIDFSKNAISDLEALYRLTLGENYAAWLRTVPTLDDPDAAPSTSGNKAITGITVPT